MKGAYSEQASGGVDVYQIRQPLGVVAGITPFNFPAMVPMWMFANAIACGNTFILKPSEKDPSASIYLAELLAEAGVPDGVFNVVQGDKVAVDRILEHPHIAAVSFVGSTPIARYIYETGTKHGKRVQALGGAKNHMVVLPDADIEMAADAAVSAAYGSSGERCMAVATVVAVGGVADPLVEAIAKRLPKINVGPGSDPNAEMGPLVTKQHRDKVASYLDLAKIQGAKVVADGRQHPLYKDSEGFFLGVSLIDDVGPGDGLLPGRDLRARPDRHPRRDVRRRPASSSTRTSTATARRSSRATAAPPGSTSSMSTSAWSGSTSRSPSRSRTTPSAAGRARSSATSTCTGPRASSSIHGARSSRRAGRTPAPRRSTSASRARARQLETTEAPWPSRSARVSRASASATGARDRR